MEKDYLKKRFGFYLLPTFFTFGNMFCGFYSIILCAQGRFILAAKMILLGMIFDILDGRVARLIKKESEFGIEIDSMADLTTFCIAPAILMYSQLVKLINAMGEPDWLLIIAFVFLMGGSLRLVRFNIKKYGVLLQSPKKRFQKTKKSNFDGLPTPAAAGFIASFFIASFSYQDDLLFIKLMPIFIVVLSYLMISNIEYPSFKEIDIQERKPFEFIVIIIFLVALFSFFENKWLMLFLVLLGYILFGLLREWIMFANSLFRKEPDEDSHKINQSL
ncbi:MAG: CDP-diacylglycerol--serine O-phosphatidyltransferase [bacterium]|nr:CDP-diacylglycerol--serine O-phosphatidyltransferase [bacterium]